jgi:hypothetical protein
MRSRTLLAALLLLIPVTLPVTAGAELWRWRDAAGGLHYSNDPARVPHEATRVRTDIGHVSTAPTPAGNEAALRTTIRDHERLELERQVLDRLSDVQCFQGWVRARQASRLLRFGGTNAFLLPDWAVADRAVAVRAEEGWLWTALAELEGRKPPGY